MTHINVIQSMPTLMYGLGFLLLVITSASCVSQAPDATVSTQQTTASPTVSPPDANSTSPSRPTTKTVRDEWTQAELPLKLYEQSGIPFTTYFPEQDFVVEEERSGTGTEVWFYAQFDGKKNESAYVSIFIPSQPLTVEAMTEAVMGEQGLIKTHQWHITGKTQAVAYPWAKERIDVEKQGDPQPSMGTVYIGEYQGKAFRITEYFPADYGDGFAPRASLILKELQFTPNPL